MRLSGVTRNLVLNVPSELSLPYYLSGRLVVLRQISIHLFVCLFVSLNGLFTRSITLIRPRQSFNRSIDVRIIPPSRYAIGDISILLHLLSPRLRMCIGVANQHAFSGILASRMTFDAVGPPRSHHALHWYPAFIRFRQLASHLWFTVLPIPPPLPAASFSVPSCSIPPSLM